MTPFAPSTASSDTTSAPATLAPRACPRRSAAKSQLSSSKSPIAQVRTCAEAYAALASLESSMSQARIET